MNKRILLLSYEFPPLLGGAGSYVYELAVGLSRIGNKVRIVTGAHEPEIEATKTDHRLRENFGVEISRIQFRGKLFFRQLHKFLGEAYSGNLRDHFNFTFLADARAAKYAFLYFSEDLIQTSAFFFHGSEYELLIEKPNFLKRFFMKSPRIVGHLMQAAAIIAVSQAIRLQWLSRFPQLKKKMTVVSSGIDESMFKPLKMAEIESKRKRNGIGSADFLLLSASRLIKEKGQDSVIKAFQQIRASGKNATLMIAGDGEFRRQLEIQAQNSGFADEIIFTGILSRQELAEHMAMSDVFILPSRIEYEGFGLVYIEANACETPVISGNTGGVTDAVNDKVTGFCVNPSNQEEIVEAIEHLFDTETKLEMGRAGRRIVLEKYTNMLMAKIIMDHIPDG
jgi:glycosyltransferase involved in cell wall biosynthesis